MAQPSSSLSYLSDHHQSYNAGLASTASLLKIETLLPSKRCVISSLLTLDIHNRDVISGLIAGRVSSNTDFEWTRYITIALCFILRFFSPFCPIIRPN